MHVLSLSTDDIELLILPEHGGDLHSLIHRSTGIDVLFKPHWQPSGISALGGDRAEWLADYRGGWQVLLPNAGDECRRDGRIWGFHGEASTVPWTVEHSGPASAELTVRLDTAPLHVRRHVALSGSTVSVTEDVANVGSIDVEAMYVHHPAFGEPFIGSGARLDAGARTIVTDPVAPGTIALAAAHTTWPYLPTSDGQIDLSRIPGRDEPRALLAYLTDFTAPYYAISNPAIGLGVAVRWTDEPFRHAWLWQEFYSTPDPPWDGQACAMAVEPATTFPGHGLTYVNDHGGQGVVIPAGAAVTAALEMTLFTPPADGCAVAGVGQGGEIRFAA